MDSKTLVAIVLSIMIIIGWQYFFMPAPPPPPPPQPQDAMAPQDQEKEKTPAAELPVAVIPSGETGAVSEREIKVENELYSAVLSSRGGTIISWTLKSFRDKDGNEVSLLKKTGVVPPLALGSKSSFDLAGLSFAVTGSDLKLDSANPTGQIVFEAAKEGVSVRRTFTFSSGTYRVNIEDEVSGLPEYWIALGSDFGIFENEGDYTHVGPALLTGTSLEELKPKKLNEPKTFTSDLRWIAQEDKYFFAGLVPQTKVEEARAWNIEASPVVAFRSAARENKFVLFAGPKDHGLLSSLGLGLEHIINFGFFSVIARPLFWILKWINSLTGNYGWSIVVLTIITRIPFIPIMNRGQKSMKKLQALQPQMTEIREKYKKDQQRMQKEMTELYRKHKVNPVSGCLPMLLQIPVFIALYKVLLVAIELRDAPFILWITDLSVKDPYYVLPIVMGVTMLIQQKMTPSTMDPTQAKLMLLMPVIFTFLFLNFASGLVLYWLVNNILGILQQIYTNRQPAQAAT